MQLASSPQLHVPFIAQLNQGNGFLHKNGPQLLTVLVFSFSLLFDCLSIHAYEKQRLCIFPLNGEVPLVSIKPGEGNSHFSLLSVSHG